MAKAPKKPKPYKMRRFGIISPYGDVWTCQTFDSREAARQHVADFWKDIGGADLSRYMVARVEVTVRVVKGAEIPVDVQ